MAKKKVSATEPGDGAGTGAAARAVGWAAAGGWPFPNMAGAAGADADDSQAPPPAAAGERIQVASINLYTDPTRNVVERIHVDQLFESPFNPRKRYDQVALEQLADTIRGVGVMQPILVRPLALTAGYQVKLNDEPVATYEIVFGHRRARAAKIAEEFTVPVIVRDLTDAQAAQLQAIENVQRKDLDAIDEALGYQHYIDVHGVSKDQLAAEIGLSRTHVYSRLKLLNAVPTVRDACQAGEIGSEVALLISRIHTPKLQEKALAAIKGKYFDLEDGGKKSYRQIREFLREKYTLDLSEALFDPKQEDLIQLAGSCTNCPKRTANAPEYADLTETRDGYYRNEEKGAPNLCTDPDCFDAKKKAHLASKAAALEAKGKTVITGNKARSAIGADGAVKGAYVALKDVKALLGKAAGKKKAPAAEQPALDTVLIQDPRTGKTVEAVKAEDLKAAGVKPPETRSTNRDDYYAKQEAERAERQARAAVDTKVNSAILMEVRAAAALAPRCALDLQLVAQVTFRGTDSSARETLALLHGFDSAHVLEKKIGQMTVEQLTTLMLDCALVENVKANGYREEKPRALLTAAKHYGVDVGAIRKDIAARAADIKTEDLFKTAQPADTAEDPTEDEQAKDEQAEATA